jgi:hypothetical protein
MACLNVSTANIASSTLRAKSMYRMSANAKLNGLTIVVAVGTAGSLRLSAILIANGSGRGKLLYSRRWTVLNFSEKEFDAMLKQNPALRINQKYSLPGKPQPTKSKYRNRKTVIDGILFDSQREASRYCELKILLRLGEITDLELQPEFLLQERFRKNGKCHRAIKYRADFRYKLAVTGETVIEDSKGTRTDVFNLKQKMFEERYPKLSLRMV